jgi:hypothetical protein
MVDDMMRKGMFHEAKDKGKRESDEMTFSVPTAPTLALSLYSRFG